MKGKKIKKTNEGSFMSHSPFFLVALSIVLLCLLVSCFSKETHVHSIVKTEAMNATCMEDGNIEYWTCSGCSKYFADEDCQQEIQLSDTVILSDGTHHSLIHNPTKEGMAHKTGISEHWSCAYCDKMFSDSKGITEISEAEILLPAPLEIDFIVEVEEGRNPVILQLTDPQLTGVEQSDSLCYRYIKETVETTKPDLIIITGDLVYGRYDNNGTVLQELISFMDSLKVPWAPVFGNHDNESTMGVDWQCEQLENAEHCLFKQRTLTGNGNYTVGIEQGGELKRVFFMMDSNGCSAPSERSKANGHGRASAGFGADQIQWYTGLATEINNLSPNTKLSFAFHIQLSVFADAFAQYGFNQGTLNNPIYIDRIADKAETDFGYIGSALKTPWDSSYTVWNGLKELGVDSIFVGHEHCNNASVVYEGVRFQFGQKSSRYDRYNCIAADGTIHGTWDWDSNGATPLIGGTVIPLSTDGTIKHPYIYYCEDAGKSVDWSQWESTE